MNKIRNEYIIPILLAIINNLVIIRGFLFNSGLVQYRDLTWPYLPSYWHSTSIYVWNHYLQSEDFIQQKSIYYWLSYLSPEISERLIYIVLIVLMTFCSYGAIYKITTSVIGAMIGSIIFVYSPVTVFRMQHKLLLMSYALSPLFIYLLTQLFGSIANGKRFLAKYVVMLALLWMFMSTSPHWAFYDILLIFSIFLFHLIVKNVKLFYYIKYSFVAIFLLVLLYLFLSSFWLIPYTYEFLILGYHLDLPYMMSEEVIRLLSRNSQIVNSIRLYGYWFPGDLYNEPPINSMIWVLLTFIIPILALSSIFIKLNNQKLRELRALLIILAVIFIALSTGYQPPFLFLYRYMVFEAPILHNFGWLFRDPYKWVFLLSTYYSILSGVMIAHLSRKKKYAIIIILLLAIPILNAYPLATGDLEGHFAPIKVPEEYKQLDSMLANQNYHYRVLFYPNYPPWGSSKPVVPITNSFYRFFLWNNILEAKTGNLGTLIGPLGIKYIVIRVKPSKNELTLAGMKDKYMQTIALLKNLINQSDLKLVSFNDYYYLFGIKEKIDYIKAYTPDEIFYINDLNTLNSLSNILPNSSNIYLFTYNSDIKFKNIILSYNYNLSNPLEQCSSCMENSIILEPYKYTIHYAPSKFWSRTSTTDPLNGEWHTYLERLGIENWQSDYGYGLAFTWSNFNVPSNLSPSNNDTIKKWLFNNTGDCFQWGKYTPTKQFNAVQQIKCMNGSLEAILYNSTWGWKIIKSPFIPVDPTHVYRFYIRIKGVNVYKAHVKIAEYRSNKSLLGIRFIKNLGDGSFGWKIITFDYMPSDPKTRYIQLQIWHGHLTNKQLPNILFIDYVKLYDVTNYAKSVVLRMPFKIIENNNYKIFVRYFENQKGGKIRFYLDGKMIDEEDTLSKINRFVWKDLGTYSLKHGSHHLTIGNIRGFNAINIVIIIPQKDYIRCVEEFEKQFINNNIIYLFEPESSMYKVGNEFTVFKNINASNGEELLLNFDSYVWQNFDVISDRYYMVAIKINGSANLELDNKTFKISSSNRDFVHVGPFYLTKGVHKIAIEPPKYPVDSWIFNNKSSVMDWMKVNPEKEFGSVQKISWDPINRALEVRLYNSTKGWKVIKSPLISVEYGNNYVFEFEIKALNSHKVHYKIVEYNNYGKIIHVKIAGNIGDGTFNWKNIKYLYRPFNKSVAYMQLQIWDGHLTNKPLPNIIWLKNVKIYRSKPVLLDVIWIYPVNKSDSKIFLKDLLNLNSNSITIISYNMINPTLWESMVSAKKPFMLVFDERYDPFWEAEVYENNTLLERVKSLPLYGEINGFWINETGNLTLIIKYVPQDWFELGIKVSIITFFISLFYLLLDWRKEKRDVWAIKVVRLMKFLLMGS